MGRLLCRRCQSGQAGASSASAKSSLTWMKRPSSRPSRASRAPLSPSAPPSSAPMRSASPNSGGVLASTTRQYSASLPTGCVSRLWPKQVPSDMAAKLACSAARTTAGAGASSSSRCPAA